MSTTFFILPGHPFSGHSGMETGAPLNWPESFRMHLSVVCVIAGWKYVSRWALGPKLQACSFFRSFSTTHEYNVAIAFLFQFTGGGRNFFALIHRLTSLLTYVLT